MSYGDLAVPTKPETSRVSSLLSYAILLGGAITIAVTLYIVISTYSSLPFWDGWTQIEVAAKGTSPFSPAWLWHQHNEHRLVLPKLFLAIDLHLFRARQVFLLASIFVIQLLHWGLLSWSMRVLGGWHGALWRAGTGLAAFCLFCPAQWENFIWGFQVCFVLPQLFATLSFVALLFYWVKAQQHLDQPPSRLLVVSILAALGASYSLASGSLLWPLLVVAAIYLRLRIAAVLSFALTGAASFALYFHHYVRPEAHASPLASLRAPLALLQYWAAYFASSWLHHDIGDAEVLALAGLAIVFALLIPALSYNRTFRPFAIQLLLMMAFCMGTALITATGRVNFGFQQAFAPRYQTVALLFWCCLGLFFLGSTFFARARLRYAFLVAEVCLLAIFARGAAIAFYPITAVRQHGFAQSAIADALMTGVYDPEVLKEAYPQMEMLLLTVPYLKINRLSAFSDRLASELGRPLDSLFALGDRDDCTASLESAVRIDNPNGRGMRILGWAWDRKHHQPPLAIVATTNGVITGLGTVGLRVPDVRVVDRELSSDYVGFLAFVPEMRPDSVVKLYAILHGTPSTACYLPVT